MSNQDVSGMSIKRFKVLVSGYINLNVIDGSAFFLSGLVGLLAEEPMLDVVLVAANPLERLEVVDEILKYPNVKIVDPYVDEYLKSVFHPESQERLSRSEYAHVLGLVVGNEKCDAIITRDTETCVEFVKKYPEFSSKLSAYITGITGASENISSDLLAAVALLRTNNSKLICQTPQMVEMLLASNAIENLDEVFVLPPQVPDSSGSFEQLYHYSDAPHKLAFTSKFFKEWNADKIIAAFKSCCRSTEPMLSMEVAGDQFRRSVDDPKFVENVKYLLLSTPGLKWHGRVNRATSRSIVAKSHLGVSWRSSKLDDSTELSTKVLEYGSLARPTILNRTVVHEQLLGEDYPLFANSMTEFRELLLNLPSMSSEVEEAARRCYEVAQKYTYSEIRPSLVEFLGNKRKDAASVSIPFKKLRASLPELPAGKYSVELDGIWLSFFPTLDGEAPEVAIEKAFLMLRLYEKAESQMALMLKELDLPRFSNSSGSSSPVSQPSKPVQSVNRQDSAQSVLRQLEEKRIENENLIRLNRKLQNDLSVSQERLRALRTSKLGRIQVRVWESRQKGK